ncbi:M48 family peptidase [Mariprofundus sp. EBB-1]|uniref:M48 family metallopeptidase n=1 Tax=Mariprofundus sp. EBB-1 TaxID=2650971 RepID=UPI000EF22179|nr:SprT family zinc-dependent metalloprotease [Mariprofundus sp. EBB-1]RLL50929.1 M48 family peptidase [Mariprofundus sp. EBB-1]
MDLKYSIIRRPKRRTVSIVIRSNNQVDVLAPSRTPADLIHQFVREKQSWIQKKLQFNKEVRACYQPKNFTTGEAFQLSGETYRLHISNKTTAIHIDDDQLKVPCHAPDTLKKLIISWYKTSAEKHFQQRSHHFATQIGVAPASIGVKTYKSRWGSCHHDGRIYFNWRLMMAPEWVIDYVIVHELCHLIHHNHSKQFWHVVEQTMPDYRHAKVWLKTNGLSLEV